LGSPIKGAVSIDKRVRILNIKSSLVRGKGVTCALDFCEKGLRTPETHGE